MPGENVYDWSVTANANGTADTLINWAEGQPRASVNNSARSLMAAVAKQRDLRSGVITTAGTANALTFVSGVSYTTTPANLLVLLKINATNTGSATLNMDGIGDVTIKKANGTDLVGSELVAGAYAEFLYNGTNWILLVTQPAGPAATTIVTQTTVVTPVTTINFTATTIGTNDEYIFELIDIVPAVNDSDLRIRVSEDNGVTWKSGAADYKWTVTIAGDYSVVSCVGSTSDSKISLTTGNMSLLASRSICGSIRLFKPSSTTSYKKFMYDGEHIGSGGSFQRLTSGGIYVGSTNPINGVQFSASTGNIASGAIKVYSLL